MAELTTRYPFEELEILDSDEPSRRLAYEDWLSLCGDELKARQLSSFVSDIQERSFGIGAMSRLLETAFAQVSFVQRVESAAGPKTSPVLGDALAAGVGHAVVARSSK